MDKWTPPPEGWLIINIDAAFKNGRATIGMIVSDERGRHRFAAAKLMESISTRSAELAAFGWASRVAEDNGWTEVEWSSDAQGYLCTSESTIIDPNLAIYCT